jgi:precorrin-3B synthase
MGFITQTNDSRRAIEACTGAPACASASAPTRDLAIAIANTLPDLVSSGRTIHVSGCIKGCACANPTSRVITARFGTYTLAMDAKADDMPLLTGLSAESIIRVLTEWETP